MQIISKEKTNNFQDEMTLSALQVQEAYPMEHTHHLCSFKGRYVATPYLEGLTLSLFNLFSFQSEVLVVFCNLSSWRTLKGVLIDDCYTRLSRRDQKDLKIGGIKENE